MLACLNRLRICKVDMDATTGQQDSSSRFRCERVRPSRAVPSLVDDVRAGLLDAPRSLPPKYFYDDRGSQLFDRICDTPEYYPTRTEAALLASHAGELIASAAPDALIEFGSGSSRKTRYLFDACETLAMNCSYWPFDVCEAMLRQSGDALMRDYDWLEVRALVGDYLAGLDGLPTCVGRRCFVFLGGTIGNFEPRQARDFLREVRARMRPGDSLILGADRVKSPAVLHAAYNDAEGVTAAFNRNVLRVLNRELGADFVPDAFRHEAVYNASRQQIEMYLVPEAAQHVHLAELDAELDLAAGEPILTEISRKFTPQDLAGLLAEAGLRLEGHFEPDNGYFSLVYATPA